MAETQQTWARDTMYHIAIYARIFPCKSAELLARGGILYRRDSRAAAVRCPAESESAARVPEPNVVVDHVQQIDTE